MVEVWTATDFLGMFGLPHDDPIALYGLYEDGVIVAYLATLMYKNTTRILSMAVATPQRRKGLGRAFVAAVCYKRQHKYAARVRESMVEAQCFLRSCGFQCARVRKGYFVNPTEDAYCFGRVHD